MIRLRWIARCALQRLGWQGLAGIGLAIAAGAFCAAAIMPLDAQIAGLKAQMSQPRAARVDVAAAAGQGDPAAQLDAFYRAFPADESLTDLLAKLHDIGEEHGLALQQAEYRAVDERGPRLDQYRITVPALATYPQLKRFLAAVLAGMPNLSLDQLSLQRHAVSDARVEVQMQFTLYLRQRT